MFVYVPLPPETGSRFAIYDTVIDRFVESRHREHAFDSIEDIDPGPTRERIRLLIPKEEPTP